MMVLVVFLRLCQGVLPSTIAFGLERQELALITGPWCTPYARQARFHNGPEVVVVHQGHRHHHITISIEILVQVRAQNCWITPVLEYQHGDPIGTSQGMQENCVHPFPGLWQQRMNIGWWGGDGDGEGGVMVMVVDPEPAR